MTANKTQIALLLTALLAACGDKPAAGPGPAAGKMPPPPEVEVETVHAGTTTITQDLPGRLQAYRTAQVRARYLATVRRAILYPRLVSISMSFSSESGRRLFSSPIRSERIFFTSKVETSSPS